MCTRDGKVRPFRAAMATQEGTTWKVQRCARRARAWSYEISIALPGLVILLERARRFEHTCRRASPIEFGP
jgi:hypothetical protein